MQTHTNERSHAHACEHAFTKARANPKWKHGNAKWRRILAQIAKNLM
jgi:hypothetical protein